MERGIYPEQKRIEVATIFALTGNFKQTSELTSVPLNTIRNWRKEEWFQSLLNEIYEENKDKLDARFEETVQKASELIMDRLTNGDFYVTKTGELARKPVGIRDIALVQAIVIDKRNLLRGLPTSRTESVNPSDKLKEFAEFFSQLANKSRPKKESNNGNEQSNEELSPVGKVASIRN
jgi:hypothetical protein